MKDSAVGEMLLVRRILLTIHFTREKKFQVKSQEEDVTLTHSPASAARSQTAHQHPLLTLLLPLDFEEDDIALGSRCLSQSLPEWILSLPLTLQSKTEGLSSSAAAGDQAFRRTDRHTRSSRSSTLQSSPRS